VTELEAGLGAGQRYRCDGCGNVTRFDVVERARTRRYHHVDLAGHARTDEEEVLERTIESVSCRWCGRDDAISVEPIPGGTDGSVTGPSTS